MVVTPARPRPLKRVQCFVQMRITNLNPDVEIGASAWYVEVDGHRFLLDCGMHPKLEGMAGLPLFDHVPEREIDAIVITHGHHDHIGTLPVGAAHFPKAQILMSELNRYVAPRVLHNSVNVMMRRAVEMKIKEYPLYRHDDVDRLMDRVQAFRYNRPVHWPEEAGRRPGSDVPALEFFDAGHTLGAAGVLIRARDTTVFYTGDVCFHDQTLLRGARFDDVRADVLVMETTRGERELPDGFTRHSEIERFVEAIRAAQKRRGCVLIPTFALGRTQEILALLFLMMEQGRLKRQPIYVGGLGLVFTEIYDQHAHRTNRNHPELRLRDALELVVLEPDQVPRLKLTGGKIFVLTAGMLVENTPAHDLAVRMVEDERQSILFVGYADPDTPGGRLLASKPGERFFMSEVAGELTRRCHLEAFDLTAHANREDLLAFVGRVNPAVVVLGHGSPAAREWFRSQISAVYPAIRVCQPGPGETLEL